MGRWCDLDGCHRSRGQAVIDPALLRREVLDRIGAGVVIVDPRTRLIEWANSTAAALFGAPADAIVGQRCHCFLCPAEEGDCPILDWGKDVDNAERMLLRHDGSELPVMKSVKRISIDGKDKLLETFVDISERKRAEAARRESQDRYRVLFENSREAMMVLAPPVWNFVSANAATLELFGVKDEATFIALAPWNLSPASQPDGRPSAEKALEMIKIAMLEGAHAFEWRHQRLDGREISASVQLTRLEFAGQSVLQATVRDLGPTERALSALRDSEMRLRLAVEATGIGTYCWDHATGKADYSPEFLALYGLPPDGVLPLGRDLAPVAVLDEDRPAFLAAMAAGNDVDGDGILKADYRVRRPDGSIRWLMAHGRTEFTGAPGMRRLAKAAGIVMDITERKRAGELAAVRTRLQEFAAGHTLEELLQATVDQAESLSGSLVGFFGFVEADERTLALQAWLPEGHPPVIRELVVPVLRQNKIVAILGVGNKTSDYTKDDVSAIATLADVAWEIAQRKRAEIDLQGSQEQLDKIFNGSTNAMALTGPSSGTFLNVNETWVRESGISRLEAIGKTAKELGQLIPWDDADECYQTLELEGRLRDYETKLVLKGVERQFVLNAEFLELRRGQCLLWEFRDITERKRAETALRESEEQLESIFNNSTNGLAFTESDSGKILKVNDTWVRMSGISRSDAIGKTTSELNMWAHEHEHEACLATLGRGGRPRDFEATLTIRGGERHLVLNADFVDLHSRRYLLWELRDITERKRAEQEIALLKHSIDVHYDAAYWTDSDSRFIYINDAGCKALGLECGELIGKTILAINENATAERMKVVWDTLRTEGFHRTESFHRRKDGSEFPVEILTSYVRFGGKEYACGFARDISERKVAEEEKAKLTGQLQQAQKMESVGRLAGGVAHDFNNMLGVILGHAELALERVDPVGPLHNDLVNIQAAAQRSADLTRQLLAFARKQTVAPKVLNLNNTVVGMLKMVRRLIGEDIKLEWRPGEDLWPVNIDPTQIDQILANLCVNARDAIASVGKITIETGTKVVDAELAAATVGMVPGEKVWLAVSDDGCGMDPATLARVFEPFFTTKEVGKGTGLGLATVYGIVKQNDGFIDARSELGHGTAFTIYFPRHVGKAAEARAGGVAGTLEPGQETILLVEDEATLLEITKRMLEKRGYKVLTAATPGQAIQIAREQRGRIDLLITDVVMPEMNGRDLAKNFLSLYPEAKRLFMSGYTADVIAHQGILDPGVFFIQKPFSAQDLAAMVRKVLGG
jgi:two-component system cell cycle sensor histidine kinase/response regulator CckA